MVLLVFQGSTIRQLTNDFKYIFKSYKIKSVTFKIIRFKNFSDMFCLLLSCRQFFEDL